VISLSGMWLRDVIWWVRNRRSVLRILAVQYCEIARHMHEMSQLRSEVEKNSLEYSRNLRDLIVKFRIALEDPADDEIRDRLDEAIRDLDDEVARQEEHIVS